MITNITLENFKCFRKVEVNPRRITAFVGPNGTGKSSVLQALGLLKQSAGSNHLELSGPLISLGGYKQVIPNFVDLLTQQIGFGGSYRLSNPQMDLSTDVQFSYESEFLDETLTANWGSVVFTRRDDTYSLTIDQFDGLAQDHIVISERTIPLHAKLIIAQLLEIPEAERLPSERFLNFMDKEVLSAPTRVLEHLTIVQAIRGMVQPSYSLRPEVVKDISLAGGLGYQEQYTASNLAYTRPLEEEISRWIKRVTGVGLRADTVPSQSVEIMALSPAGDVNIVAEGFGTNALIVLFWQLASATKDATVLIEEPEIHLHPKAQAELASVLVEEAQAEDKQIIMTTHSEHIIGRLLTLVAEKKLPAEELAIYAFEKDEKGECSAQQLEVTEDGKVVGGIKDFFESDLDELERYINALKANQ